MTTHGKHQGPGDGRALVAIVYGTRPEAIKIAPLYRSLVEDPRFLPVLISTGQHRDMLREIHDWFAMSPHLDLGLMTTGQTLEGLTARVIEALTPYLRTLRPDAVVVHGDTTTSTAGALAARYAGVPVVHLEAGLRTGDLHSPFPEELNRRLTGVMADLHLAPTAAARENLVREGVPEDQVVVTGNTVIDALLHTASRRAPVEDPLVAAAQRDASHLVVATLHRRESFGEPLREVAEGLRELLHRFPRMRVVLPLHPNPQVRASIGPVVDLEPRFVLCEPLPYPQFVSLLRGSDLIVTDSGGIQEEAPSLNVPVLVARESTERPEAVAAGTAVLVGTSAARLVQEATRLLSDESAYRQMARVPNPFGDGQAAERSVLAIAKLTGVLNSMPV
jgi:UDP-N-acetylglucosamine 2-epimerase (non-hydrolysing)